MKYKKCMHAKVHCFNTTAWLLVALSLLMMISSAEAQIHIGEKVDKVWTDEYIELPDQAEPILGVATKKVTLLLYQLETEQLRLSRFIDGKEQVLWQFVDGGAVLSSQVPPPQIILCELDGKLGLDVILVYAENMAGGAISEAWQQNMVLFLNGKENPPQRITLANKDVLRNKETVSSVLRPDEPATIVRSFAYITPATGRASGMIVVQRWKMKTVSIAKLGTDIKTDDWTGSDVLRYEWHKGELEKIIEPSRTLDEILRIKPTGQIGIVITCMQ